MPRRRPRPDQPPWLLPFAGGAALLGGLALLGLVAAVFSGAPLGRSRTDSFRESAAACASQGAAGTLEDGFCYPTDAAACTAAGGLWGFLGPTTGQGCTAVAPDSGARCRSGRDCTSGHCLAILTPEVTQRLAAANRPVPADGLCAGLTRVRGCNALVEAGQARAVTCRT